MMPVLCAALMPRKSARLRHEPHGLRCIGQAVVRERQRSEVTSRGSHRQPLHDATHSSRRQEVDRDQLIPAGLAIRVQVIV